MIGLDTNVLVRYLTRDDLEQFDLVKQFIQQNCTESSPGFINSIVLCELIWVLESSYGYPKRLIVDVLERVLQTKQFHIESASVVWQALTVYRESKADFADCLISRANLQQGCTRTVTLDRKAAKTPGFERL